MSVSGPAKVFGLLSVKLQKAVRGHQLMIELLAAFLGNNGCDNDAAVS